MFQIYPRVFVLSFHPNFTTILLYIIPVALRWSGRARSAGCRYRIYPHGGVRETHLRSLLLIPPARLEHKILGNTTVKLEIFMRCKFRSNTFLKICMVLNFVLLSFGVFGILGLFYMIIYTGENFMIV